MFADLPTPSQPPKWPTVHSSGISPKERVKRKESNMFSTKINFLAWLIEVRLSEANDLTDPHFRRCLSYPCSSCPSCLFLCVRCPGGGAHLTCLLAGNLPYPQAVLGHWPALVLRAGGREGAAEEVSDLLVPCTGTEFCQPSVSAELCQHRTQLCQPAGGAGHQPLGSYQQ